MTYESRDIPSVYDETYHRLSRGELATGMIARSLMIILALFVIRTGNIIFTYHINKKQLTRLPIINAQNSFIGLSGSRGAREELERLAFSNRTSATILCYYNLLQPAIFLISQKGSPQFQEFGPVAVYIPAGHSKVSLLGQHYFNFSHQKQRSMVYTGRAPLSPFFREIAENVNLGKPQSVSYAMKPLSQYPSLRIPYMIYFFLPVLLILFLRTTYSPAIYICFAYYIMAFLLFNPTDFFFTGPFHWVFSMLKLELPPHSIRLIIAIFLALSAGVATFIGLMNWKKSVPDSWERTYILFFILIPLALVF